MVESPKGVRVNVIVGVSAFVYTQYRLYVGVLLFLRQVYEKPMLFLKRFTMLSDKYVTNTYRNQKDNSHQPGVSFAIQWLIEMSG